MCSARAPRRVRTLWLVRCSQSAPEMGANVITVCCSLSYVFICSMCYVSIFMLCYVSLLSVCFVSIFSLCSVRFLVCVM